MANSEVKDRLITFINSKGLSKNKFEQICGLSTRYVSNISVSIPPDKIKKISTNFPELNTGWLLTGDGAMLREISGDRVENSGTNSIVINGNNKGTITNTNDNRQYYSDSPDVLRAQIELLDERIKEKDAQIKEKDAQIKEKDAQIKEKDAQIKQLLDILSKR